MSLQGSAAPSLVTDPDGDVEIGGYIGRYRIIAELGQGGMANVLLAVAQGPAGVQKLVALKVLRSAVAAEPETLSMFLDEARLAAQLNHSNVVKTYEVGAEGDRYLIVMEYLEGQPLSAMLRRGLMSGTPVPLPHLIRVMISVLEGLHYAHELASYDGTPLRLVHRDISPQNVFITYDGQVKLVDFGIAKATSSENHTATGVIKGKLSYMAPEQMVASGIDRRADIYSVGCMLWAAAAQAKLWEGVSGVEIARSVMQGRVPPPSSVNPDCSPELERIVMKALAFDPDQRFQTALEFQEALEAYCETLPTQSREKDVGAFVAGLFSEQRTRLRAALERELKLAPHDPRGMTGSRSSTGSTATRAEPALLESTEAAAAGKGSRTWLVALALMALAAAILVYPRLQAPETVKPPAPQAALASAALPGAAVVEWELSAEPSGAKLTLDGEPLPSNPAKVSLARQARTRVLAATAEGFAPKSQEFSVDRSGRLRLSLEATTNAGQHEADSAASRKPRGKWVRPSPAPAETPAPAAAAPAPPPPSEPAKASCDQPFFINSEGIKSVRPECM
jgi:serine/threonine protein kinase